MTVYAIISGEVVIAVFGDPHPNGVPVHENTREGDGYVGGVVYFNPGGLIDFNLRTMYTWGGLDSNDDPVWIIDYARFTPHLFDQLDNHLQELLSSRHLYVVDGVDAYFKNDNETRQAISDYLVDKDAVNDPLYYIDFKARDIDEKELWVRLNGGQIQGLKHSLTTRMKNAFIALKLSLIHI